MSKHLGLRYGSNKISKHSDLYFKETEEVFDYVRNERRYREKNYERTNKQTGKDWSIGLGYFPKKKPALPEGKTCTTVALHDDASSTVIGVKYGSRKITPKKGQSDDQSDEEVTDCPIDIERPGLRYKRTRKRKIEYKEGDHLSQSSFGVGFSW